MEILVVLGACAVFVWVVFVQGGFSQPARPTEKPEPNGTQQRIDADRAEIRAQVERNNPPQGQGVDGVADVVMTPVIGIVLAGVVLLLPLMLVGSANRNFTLGQGFGIVVVVGLLIGGYMLWVGSAESGKIQREREAERQALINRDFDSAWAQFMAREYDLALEHFAGTRRVVPGYVLADQSFGADRDWGQAVRADAERAIAAIGQGKTATLKQWNVEAGLGHVFTYDFTPAHYGMSVIVTRRANRERALEQVQQEVAQAEDRAFEAAVNADRDRVIAELRAGRSAELKTWSMGDGFGI